MPQVRFVHLGGPISPLGRFFLFLFLLLVLTLVIAIAILAIGLFVIIAPVLIALALALYVFRKIVGPRPPPSRPNTDGVIEGEFRVIDPDAPRIPTRDANNRPE
jgi:hypothetical protein